MTGREPKTRGLRPSKVVALGALVAVAVTACGGAGSSGSGGPQNGGKLVISWKDDFKTFDPAIGYDVDSWIAERAIFNGLLDYRQNATTLQPDIAAAMPTISPDGKIYTFKLKHGVKFTNGREVVADDFKYSWERMLDPKTNGPMTGGPFWSIVHGTADFFKGTVTHISGIKVIDSYTLEIDLDSPNLSFLNILAMPFGFVVPKEVVAAEGSDFAKHPVGTGLFKIASYTAGQKLVLKKNTAYFGTPAYLDEVDFDIGVAPEVGYLRLENGQTDLPNPDVTMPSAQYLKLSADPRWARVLQNQTNVDIWYLAMNVHMAPFTNKLVREAFNMIVNKANQVRVLNGRGVINNGIQAPTMPGFQDQSTYNPLSLDQNGQNLTMAKQLLAQAGYSSKHPFPKVALVYPKSSDTADQLAASVQQDFASAGVNLTLQGLAFASYLDVVGKPKTTALSYGGWIQDFPDPSDFVDPILSCSAANVTANGSNQSFYCSKQVDQLADQARGDNNKTERTQLYKQIQDIVVTQDFPWVPMYTDVQTNVAAPRVHGYHISPVWLLTFNNIWVTGPAPSS